MNDLIRKIVLTILFLVGVLVQNFYSVKIGLVIEIVFLILLWIYPTKQK